MSDLAELLERVCAATGPNRALDLMIKAALSNVLSAMTYEECEERVADREAFDAWSATSPYTASIDAALALVERMLPGKLWGVDTRGVYRAQVGLSKANHFHSAPLAILAALLSALIAQQKRSREAVRKDAEDCPPVFPEPSE